MTDFYLQFSKNSYSNSWSCLQVADTLYQSIMVIINKDIA